MKNQLHKDKKKRHFIVKNEKKKFILKSISKNNLVSKPVQWESSLEFSVFPKVNNPIGLVNRCILTGRKKKINKLFKISRLTFLKIARNGYINGLKKSTW